MKKIMKIILIFILITIFITLILYKYQMENKIPILAYHDVKEYVEKDSASDTNIEIKKFEEQMKYISNNKYKTMSLDEFYDWKMGKKINGKKVVITFDDGFESIYTKVLPILKKYNLKATVFIVQSRINEKNYLSIEEIEELKKDENRKYIEIENHSYNLHTIDNGKCNEYEKYNNDLKINEMGFKYYAYPFGLTNNNYKKALKDNNYKLAFIFGPGRWATRKNDNYEISRLPIYNSTSYIKFKLKLNISLTKPKFK